MTAFLTLTPRERIHPASTIDEAIRAGLEQDDWHPRQSRRSISSFDRSGTFEILGRRRCEVDRAQAVRP